MSEGFFHGQGHRSILSGSVIHKREYVWPASDRFGVLCDREGLQHELVQIPLNNHILHTLHRNLQQVGVRCVGEVAIDLLVWVAVEGAELVHEVLAGRLPVAWVALEIWETVLGDWVSADLLLEKIHLVEEENEGRVGEPLRVSDGLPKHERFLHLVL